MHGRCLYVVAFMAATAGLHAQEVPGTLRPGQVEQQFERPPEARVLDDLVLLEAPSQDPPANAETVTITVSTIAVRGAVVFTQAELLAPHAHLIGTKIPLTRVYQIANDISARYRAAGFVLSRAVIGEQRFQKDSAAIEIDVVEGYIADIDYAGQGGGREGLLLKMAQDVMSERPHRQKTLERYLLLLNDMSGATAVVNGTYVPMPGDPGAFRVIVGMAHDTFSASISQTNRGSDLLGPSQSELSIGLNSMFGLYEQTAFRYISAGSGELDLLSLSQSYWLTAGGGKLTWSVTSTDANPDSTSPSIPLNFETESNSGSITFEYPLRRSRRSNFDVRIGLTYHDGRTDSSFNGFSVRTTRDQIAAVRAGFTFDWVDSLRGINLIDLEVSKGFEALGASNISDPDLSRAGGKPDFGKVRAYVARVQSLSSMFSLLFAAEGQYSDDNLLSPEQYGVGGATFVRAYDASEIVGDSGASGKAELRMEIGNNSARGNRAMIYGFYEGGFVEREEATFGQTRRESLTSTGGGVRFTLFGRLNGFVEAAVPVRRVVALEGNDDTRIFGGVSLQF